MIETNDAESDDQFTRFLHGRSLYHLDCRLREIWFRLLQRIAPLLQTAQSSLGRTGIVALGYGLPIYAWFSSPRVNKLYSPYTILSQPPLPCPHSC